MCGCSLVILYLGWGYFRAWSRVNCKAWVPCCEVRGNGTKTAESWPPYYLPIGGPVWGSLLLYLAWKRLRCFWSRGSWGLVPSISRDRACCGHWWEALVSPPRLLSVPLYLFLQLLDLEHQSFSPDPLLPFQQGLVQLQLLLQQLLSLVQLNCVVGLGSCWGGVG